ncbi:Spo0B domain-containing protein [Effusibacillus pohliae]|uniref:Spo0B domain-containing protein n=1 Tax=Effusibacillus pohliae TaxID=232270 RepID=UPI0003629E81|nr:Spo0B domain-containing protein [Effusibacillus pohliae]
MKPAQGKWTSTTKLALRWLAVVQAVGGTAMLAGSSMGETRSWMVGAGGAGLLAAAVCSGWLLPLLLQREFNQRDNHMRLESLRMMSQYRHDVMNQIQLVKGYLQMEKFDRLQHPVQKLISDAQRHSALSNLPGTKLAYALIERDLLSPLLRLQVELAEPGGEWDERLEDKILAVVMEVADAGETLSQELGVEAEWKLELHNRPQSFAITLRVLGEHVNDIYIQDVIEQLAAKNWDLQKREQDGEAYILSFGSQVNRDVC